ncbi:MAG: FadR family transcriptional regulator [Anaerolineales bacterium]|nr:FadR family transcriptional regulator [Anaerolineales bacterium]
MKSPPQIKRQTLAEQMADSLQEAILNGEWAPGDGLPTEPELAAQFGVSRAVVRDATRMLVAQGLVRAEHGRGVFVTEPDNDAFADALLLALRRVDARVWDLERFQQIMFPELLAAAVQAMTAADLDQIREQIAAYLAHYAALMRRLAVDGTEATPAENAQLLNAFRQLMTAIFQATHNKVFMLLARPLLNLANFRDWQRADQIELAAAVEDTIARETAYFQRLLRALESDDPQVARAIGQTLLILPPEAVQAMQATPIGERVTIPPEAWQDLQSE